MLASIRLFPGQSHRMLAGSVPPATIVTVAGMLRPQGASPTGQTDESLGDAVKQ